MVVGWTYIQGTTAQELVRDDEAYGITFLHTPYVFVYALAYGAAAPTSQASHTDRGAYSELTEVKDITTTIFDFQFEAGEGNSLGTGNFTGFTWEAHGAY